MPRPSVLVTGASGVVGSALVKLLDERGYEPIAVDSSLVDLRNLEPTVAFFADAQPRFVIHLAARVRGLMGNVQAQGEMYLDNLRINTNVIDAARLANVTKVVAMGSVSVYSDVIDLPMREVDLWTGAPHKSEMGYAHAKRSMLAQLEAYEDQYGIDFAFAVSTNLFGPNDRFDETTGHVFPSLMSKFHRGATVGGSVEVWGSGTATRDFLYSFDAARALIRLLEDGSGVYNVASGTQVTIGELAETMAKVTHFDGEIRWDRSKPDGQADRAYDITRIASLGWAPQVQLEGAISATYDWYKANIGFLRH